MRCSLEGFGGGGGGWGGEHSKVNKDTTKKKLNIPMSHPAPWNPGRQLHITWPTVTLMPQTPPTPQWGVHNAIMNTPRVKEAVSPFVNVTMNSYICIM